MTDEQIIKALECCLCSDKLGRHDCCECDLFEEDCIVYLRNATIDLINRQKAEIEIWKDIARRQTSYVELAKVEAIKEFAERLKSTKKYSVERHENIVPIAVIDWIVKEMTEEKENAGKVD